VEVASLLRFCWPSQRIATQARRIQAHEAWHCCLMCVAAVYRLLACKQQGTLYADSFTLYLLSLSTQGCKHCTCTAGVLQHPPAQHSTPIRHALHLHICCAAAWFALRVFIRAEVLTGRILCYSGGRTAAITWPCHCCCCICTAVKLLHGTICNDSGQGGSWAAPPVPQCPGWCRSVLLNHVAAQV
jgi:hypothetical protein